MICSAALCNIEGMANEDLLSPGARLAWARKQAGYENASDFAKRVDLKPVTYRAYEADQNSFAKHAHVFAERLNVDIKWLMEGGTVPTFGDPVSTAAEEMGLQLVPHLELGYSMGGGAIFNDYRHIGAVPFDREFLRSVARGSLKDLFVAQGVGDSMMPTLLDGDIVLIDTSQKRIEQQDRLWALGYGDLGMIKRVRRLPSGQYSILSDNQAVEPFQAADDEMYVVGRVVYIGRKV